MTDSQPGGGGGHDPERTILVARTVQARSDARQGEQAARAHRKRQMIGLAWGALTGTLLAMAGVIWGLHGRAQKADALLAPAIAPFVEAGFARVSPGFFSSSRLVEVDVPEGTCVLAVATPGAGAIHLDRAGGSDTATGSLLRCGCAPEHLVARVDPAPHAVSAVALLRVDGRAVGGRFGAAFLEPRPALLAAGGEECAADELEGYVADARYPKSAPSASWRETPVGRVLAARGFLALARVPVDRPLAVLEPATDRCFIATGGGATIALRVAGDIVAEGASVAWCVAKVGAALVERVGPGTIDVAVAPARRTGGLLGLRDVLEIAGVVATVWAPPKDHAALAAEALRASLVPDVVLSEDGSILKSASADARVVSLSTSGAPSFEPDSASDAFFLCAPPLGAATRQNLCVQTAAQGWHPPPAHVAAGAAYGPLPYWLSAWSKSRDPVVVHFTLALIALARRLESLGFEPTIIEGVTEEPTGASVIGRGGDDAIVAVGVWPAPPWAAPYGDPPWTVDGEPRVVPLAGGQRVRLPAHVRTAAPLGARRTVVFRHPTSR